MPFIGNQPTQGRFIELDSVTTTAGRTYGLQLNSANFSPESVNNLLVSINGIIQGSSTMSLNGAVLTVGAVLSNSDTIDFVRVLGNVGTVSTPTDGSVTANKIGTGAVTSAKIADDAVVLTSKVSGVLPVANGGTGVSSGFSYSQNTFTPTWSAYTPYSTSGKYIKIGTQVIVYAELVTNSSTDNGFISITNLPFTVSGKLGGGSVYHNTPWLYSYNLYTFYTANSTTCQLKTVSGGSETGVKYVNTSGNAMGGYSSLYWTLMYQTS